MRTQTELKLMHYIKAPGEAEAQLAWMSNNDMIDAVLTNDSDTLVFGAKIVIKESVLFAAMPRCKCSSGNVFFPFTVIH